MLRMPGSQREDGKLLWLLVCVTRLLGSCHQWRCLSCTRQKGLHRQSYSLKCGKAPKAHSVTEPTSDDVLWQLGTILVQVLQCCWILPWPI